MADVIPCAVDREDFIEVIDRVCKDYDLRSFWEKHPESNVMLAVMMDGQEARIALTRETTIELIAQLHATL